MSNASRNHSTDSIAMGLDNYLTPRQIRRLEKKAHRQGKSCNVVPVNFTHERPVLKPKNATQSHHIEMMKAYDQVITVGPAGTGKTYLTAWYAADLLERKEIKKIIVTRPNVPTGRSIGLFPGSLEEKMAPWLAPVTSVLKIRLGEGAFDTALKNGKIVYQPIETIRGASFEDSFVILDEAQNVTIDEAKAILTRIGENSKIVIDGDIKQSDLGDASGLVYILDMVKKNNQLRTLTGLVEYSSEDIVRSGLCRAWVEAFEGSEK